MVKRECW